MSGKLDTTLKENKLLKEELEHLLKLVKENESKHKGFQVVENALLISQSIEEIDSALSYLEEIFDIDRVVLYIDKAYFQPMIKAVDTERVRYVDEKILRYAYVDKRPYFGTYVQGLISDFHALEEIGSYLIAPVLEGGRLITSLNLYSKNPNKISSEGHDGFIRELALRLGITIKNLHNVFTIKFQAEHDFLMGIYNKSMMHTLLDRAIKALRETGEGFTFILCDIDNFKDFNSYYGHVVGDEILKGVADSARNALKDEGTLGRFGGDELYIILNYTEIEKINAFYDRMTSSFMEFAPAYGGISLSGGFVRVPNDIDLDKEDAVDIVKKADSGLFQCKNTGKGAIIVGK